MSLPFCLISCESPTYALGIYSVRCLKWDWNGSAMATLYFFFFPVLWNLIFCLERNVEKRWFSSPCLFWITYFPFLPQTKFFEGWWYIFALQFRPTVYSCCEYYSRPLVQGFKFVFFWAPYESHTGLALFSCIKHFAFPLFSLGS